MSLRFLLRVAGAAALMFSLAAHAKLFSNSYVSFELPPNWDCKREGTEWLCVSSFSAKSKEAIIILTAKEVGPTDSLASYMAHLKEPRSLPSKSGPPTSSKVVSVVQRNISNHPWVDGLHMGSEVSTYYTRYLGTVKDRIAILVTFSAHRSHYTQYSNDFIRAIESLRVTATKDQMPSAAAAKGPSGPIGAPIPGGRGDGQFETFPAEDSSGGVGKIRKFLGLALILLAVGIFIYLRSRKKGQR